MSDNTLHIQSANDILSFLQAHSEEQRAMGVKQIGLFGSYARGEQTPNSDVDFLFSMDNMTWAGWMDVWNWLEDHLGLEVDLVPEKDLHDDLKPNVLAEVRYAEIT
ncbi:MAG: nucleotidyltransferase family protein [Chloroflexota bacterium]